MVNYIGTGGNYINPDDDLINEGIVNFDILSMQKIEFKITEIGIKIKQILSDPNKLDKAKLDTYQNERSKLIQQYSDISSGKNYQKNKYLKNLNNFIH